jgi:putative membrane protein insertion efficiency factor
MKKILMSLIKVYQKFSSKTGVKNCRFYPTCSQYSLEALEKYGAVKGSYLSFKRIIRCHPFNKGGYDPLI